MTHVYGVRLSDAARGRLLELQIDYQGGDKERPVSASEALRRALEAEHERMKRRAKR